ncbi:MAG: tRNA (guanosine(37)-N1)-methyltransferase TrmD [Patescibacteria group bacterium]|jgi:tRNA (guanine37-N1)-methyltransferase
MTYHIITTQPSTFESFLKTGLIARGIENKIIDVKIHSLYDFAADKHRTIDDSPYGGGPGMVLRVDIMDKALSKLKTKSLKLKTILLTPQGKRFTQKDTKRLSKERELILVSGRFEGYDERIRQLIDEEISIGDYILTSGDLPAMVLIDAISRHLPGFIQEKESLKNESFNNNLLEYPQYTRPPEYKKLKVPAILLSGDHAKIKRWRETASAQKTRQKRQDLLNI